MTNDKKPREFWVVNEPKRQWYSSIEISAPSDIVTHVIEHSAYAALQKENEELKKYRNNYDLQEENKSLRESLAIAVKELETMPVHFGNVLDKLATIKAKGELK